MRITLHTDQASNASHGNGSSAARIRRTERYETIIVGGGQAGLAAGYHLARDDRDFAILDAAAAVGDSWRTRWDSLRLFTPARYSSLPGLPFPAAPYHFPDKDETADYLSRYADRFCLPVHNQVSVTAMEYGTNGMLLHTNDRLYECDRLIVATGPLQRPKVPRFAPSISEVTAQLHSSQYRNPGQLPDGDVLVVGVGNSGAQIALELSRTRRVYLAGNESGALPRRLLGRDIYDWIWPVLTRATRNTALGRRLYARSRGADPLIGISTSDLRHHRIIRVPRVTGVADGHPLSGTERLNVSSIIWCTGFEQDFGWLPQHLLTDRGDPRQEAGASTADPSVFFLGLRFMTRHTSALLGGVGADAEVIATKLGRTLTS